MINRRRNWKEDLSKQAQERAKARTDLLVRLDETRKEIKKCGLDFQQHDRLKLEQRTIVAQLATL